MGFEKKEEFEETSFLARNVTPITTWCICFIFWIAVGMDPEDKMTQPPVGESKMEYGGGVFLILTIVITLWATMTVTTTEKVYAEQLEAYRVRLEQQQ